MIIAVNLKTESGDSYLFLKEGVLLEQDMVEHIKDVMAEDFEYVWSYDVSVIRGDSRLLSTLLQEAVAEAQNGN